VENSKEARVILGVDPGFHVTGFAIVNKTQQRVLLSDCGYLKLNPKNSLSRRTGEFYQFFLEKIKQFNVSDISLETSFLGKNPQTFLKLGFLRGILYLLADQHKLELTEFAPRHIKTAVTGFGGASKDQVASIMIQLFPGLNDIAAIARNDVTDALAIALCGVWSLKSLNRLNL
jgi:crossover junction endodeoxyribonuclease RuvC